MSIPVICAGCGTSFKIDAMHAGRQGRCKQCGAVVVVPFPPQESAFVATEDEDLAFGETTVIRRSTEPVASFKLVSKEQRQLLGGGAFILFLMIVVFVAAARTPPNSQGDWKASGDGKTIFNSKTGELRDIATGLSVAELNVKREKELQARQQEFEQQRKAEAELAQFRASLSAKAYEAEIENRTRAEENNNLIFQRVKKFVDDHPKIDGIEGKHTAWGVWDLSTKPFRSKKTLTRTEHEYLLDFLGTVVKVEPYKSDRSFREIIETLHEWDFTYSP